MVNSFTNDHAYISTKWFMWLVHQQGLPIKHLLWITHLSGGQAHYLVLMGDGWYVCNCCMGLSLSIPCRHYFQALMTVPRLQFTIVLIWPRSKQLYVSCDNLLTGLQMVSEPTAQCPASANHSIWHRLEAAQLCNYQGATHSFFHWPPHTHPNLWCINPTASHSNSLCLWSSFWSIITTSGTDSQCQHLRRLRWPLRPSQSNQVSHLHSFCDILQHQHSFMQIPILARGPSRLISWPSDCKVKRSFSNSTFEQLAWRTTSRWWWHSKWYCDSTQSQGSWWGEEMHYLLKVGA